MHVVVIVFIICLVHRTFLAVSLDCLILIALSVLITFISLAQLLNRVLYLHKGMRVVRCFHEHTLITFRSGDNFTSTANKVGKLNKLKLYHRVIIMSKRKTGDKIAQK